LRGAIEVALIEGGSSANSALRGMVQWVTKLVNAYNDLPPGLQHAATLLTGIGGAATLAVTGFVLLLPRIAATRTALAEMGVTAARTRVLLNGLGRMGVVVATLEAMSFGADKLKEAFEDAPPNVSKMGSALYELGKDGKASGELIKTFGANLDGFGDAVARIAHPGVLDRVGDSLYTITHLGSDSQGLDEARAQLNSVDEALKSLVEGGAPDVAAAAFNRMAKEAEAQGTSTEKLRTLLPGYSNALTDTDTQSKMSADSQAALAKQMGLTADEIQDQRTEAEKLADVLQGLMGTSIDAAQQEISFRQSVADLTKAVKDNGHSLDVSTDKGRKVKGAFLDAAKAAMEHAKAVAEQKNSQQAGQKVLDQDISLLKKQMSAAGFSKDAIDRLAAAYLKLPAKVDTEVDAKTAQSMADLEAVQRKVKGTKGKSFTMGALTGDARKALEDLGFKIKNTKGKKVEITLPTGGPRAAAQAIQGYINGVHGKTVGIGVYTTEYYKKVQSGGAHSGPQVPGMPGSARGGLVPRYAEGGGVQVGPNGVVRGPGTGRSDSILAFFASGAVGRIANTEFVVNAASTKRYLPLLTAINQNRIPGFASGGLLGGFTYTPSTSPVLGGTSDPKSRYDTDVQA
ncbi:hypothetical protein, partial [Streptomyces longwoodensis]